MILSNLSKDIPRISCSVPNIESLGYVFLKVFQGYPKKPKAVPWGRPGFSKEWKRSWYSWRVRIVLLSPAEPLGKQPSSLSMGHWH